MVSEKIQEHEYQDVYRIQDGVLLKVNKFKRESFASTYYASKDSLKRIKGLKGGIVTTRSVHLSRNIIPAGTVILDHYIVTPIANPNQFTYELKFSGGAVGGNIGHFAVFSKKISEILNSYYAVEGGQHE